MTSSALPSQADDAPAGSPLPESATVAESADPAPGASPGQHRHWYRLGLGLTVLLVLLVLGLLPFAVRSMQEVLGRTSDPLYDLVTGQVDSAAIVTAAQAETVYVNIGVVDLDESTGQVTLAISGNRHCANDCWNNVLTLVALDDDADQRRGLPPSATLTLGPNDRIFSQTVQLPIRGQPSLYPFDTYHLWLGIAGESTTPDGQRIELNLETLAQRQAVMTIQNRVPDMLMLPPTPIATDSVQAASDPQPFFVVQSLSLQRPAYLQVLAVVLIGLMAISTTLAICTRGVDDLALGVGGLILGVWGIRAVLMPQSIGTVTAIDLALSWLILLLLLGLALRAARHFHRHSDLPWSSPSRSH